MPLLSLPFLPLDPALLDGRTRLYRLEPGGPAAGGGLLPVEAWSLRNRPGKAWRMELGMLRREGFRPPPR